MFLANLQAFSQHIDINTTKTLRKFPTWESRLGYVINGPGHAIIIKQGLDIRKNQIIHHHLNDRNTFPVKLKWNYKGHIFYTYCIISSTTQEVVYDNILSNIHTIIVSAI